MLPRRMGKLIPCVSVSTRRAPGAPVEMSSDRSRSRLTVRLGRLGWRPLGAFDYFPDCGSELIHARARHDDGVAAAVCFFRNPQEFSTLVLAKLHVKVLAFDLQLFTLDDIIHF